MSALIGASTTLAISTVQGSENGRSHKANDVTLLPGNRQAIFATSAGGQAAGTIGVSAAGAIVAGTTHTLDITLAANEGTFVHAPSATTT